MMCARGARDSTARLYDVDEDSVILDPDASFLSVLVVSVEPGEMAAELGVATGAQRPPCRGAPVGQVEVLVDIRIARPTEEEIPRVSGGGPRGGQIDKARRDTRLHD